MLVRRAPRGDARDGLEGGGGRFGGRGREIFGFVFYVIGFYFLTLYAVYIAPLSWKTDAAFRVKWAFLIARWRSDRWYWGPVLMTRNLFVALSGVVSSEPRIQLSFAIGVIIITFASTAWYQPWKAPKLNYYDVISCILLCIIATCGLIFASLNEEIGYVKRLEEFTILDRKGDTRDVLIWVLLLLIGLFIFLFATLVGWTVMGMQKGWVQKTVAMEQLVCDNLLKLTLNTTASKSFAEKTEKYIDNSTAYERDALYGFLNKLEISPDSSPAVKIPSAATHSAHIQGIPRTFNNMVEA